MGASYAYLGLTKRADSVDLSYVVCNYADKGGKESETLLNTYSSGNCWFRVVVSKGAVCRFAYSSDGEHFTIVPHEFIAEPGRWIGAKTGFFCTRTQVINDAGWADIYWVKIGK